jgi:NitT/TauT family transport system substrate-binding protein
MKPTHLVAIVWIAVAVVAAACSPAAPAPSATSAPAAAAAPTATTQMTSLTVSYSELTPINMALWVADDQGYFKAHGLAVDTRYLESSLGVSALLANEEQFASMGGSETLAAVVNGADLEVLASFSPVYPYKLEVAAPIKNAQDLKGKKLGVSRFGSSSDSATRAALREIGLADTDVTFVQVGNLADRTAALLNGNLDGAVTGLPDTMILEDRGFHPLVDLAAEQLPAVNNVLVARKSWVDAHHDVTQAYVDSVIQGIARAKADKPLALGLISKYLQDRAGNEAQASAAYDYDIGAVLRIPPAIKPEQFHDALTQLAATNPKATDFDVKTIIDDSFVENAARN